MSVHGPPRGPGTKVPVWGPKGTAQVCGADGARRGAGKGARQSRSLPRTPGWPFPSQSTHDTAGPRWLQNRGPLQRPPPGHVGPAREAPSHSHGQKSGTPGAPGCVWLCGLWGGEQSVREP